MHELEQEIHKVNVERRALEAVVKVEGAGLRTVRAEKENLHNLLVEREANSKTDRKRRWTGDIYSGLILQRIGMEWSEKFRNLFRYAVLEKMRRFLPLKRWRGG